MHTCICHEWQLEEPRSAGCAQKKKHPLVFSIVCHAEYVSFEISPTAGSHQWDKVLAAFDRQLSSLTNCGAPPSVPVFFYNIRRVPKFSCKAQGGPPHDSLVEDEHGWECNVLKAHVCSCSPLLILLW